MTPMANLPPVSLSQWSHLQFSTGINATSSIPVAKLTTGVVDTDGKFATSVIDTSIALDFQKAP
jgi:hypothetical protein